MTTITDYSLGETEQLSAENFIDNKLKSYSAHSNVRGIPFLGDGMKQAHRKAIWGLISRGEGADFDTVERLAARCAADTDYHHGTGSMEGTIVTLAQRFAGANNVSLIEGKGQFGNRLSKKPASSRYIKAKLSPNFRKYFKKADDLIIEHHLSNGEKIEPLFFIPVLPMRLVNGSEGMGTGHSTYILNYNPADLKETIQKILSGKKVTDGTLVPWFDGFKGTVKREGSQIIIRGNYELNKYELHITELPVGTQDDAYEDHLKKLVEKGVIKDFQNFSEENAFDYRVKITRDYVDQIEFNEISADEIRKTFKLISRETENLTLWDTNGELKRFNSPEEIIKEFVEWRLGRYEDRRKALIKLTEEEIIWLDERIRFINFYLANTTLFKNTGKKELLQLLLKEQFTQPEKLLSMQIWALTLDVITKLEEDLQNNLDKLTNLQNTNANYMYSEELKELKF